jgi:protein gp37
MNKTPIEWTDMSTNPIRARRIDGTNRVPGHYCEKISAGCANCYASRTQPRFGMPVFDVRNKPLIESYLEEKELQKVLRRRKPSKIFWCDMTDMFLDDHPFEWIDKCFAIMALTPQHSHQVLTKRPERMKEYIKNSATQNRVNDIQEYFNGGGNKPVDAHFNTWPLPNVWLGVSVEDQKTADERISILLNIPAAIRWISVEPLLGPVNLRCLNQNGIVVHDSLTGYSGSLNDGLPINPGNPRIDWVIVGGESGSKARPMHPTWVRSLRDQCSSTNTSFFFKQWGSWSPITTSDGRQLLPFGDYDTESKFGFKKVGKKNAGRLIDGVEYSQFPKVKEVAHA